MSFIASKLLWPLAAPGNFLLLMLAVGAVLMFTRWRRFGRGLVAVVTIVLIGLAFLPVAQWVTVPLEDRFARPEPMPARVDGIVILGGALGTSLVADRGEVSIGSMGERILAGIALMRRYPEARVIYTGGDPTLQGLGPNPTEAEAARPLLASLGVDVGRISFEAAARNTYENAVLARQAMAPQPGEVWLLVTSAWHMPRSVGVFRKVGWEVVPYPVDYVTSGRFWRNKGVDLTGELGGLSLAVHEWIGLVAYWLLGYSDTLFPAPSES
jgi:uncharacterized SAM-binding protein YcdF (DUF218 family)